MSVCQYFYKIMKKLQISRAKKVFFHYYNALAHASASAKKKLIELRYELLLHPPYSQDLFPCDFFLFPTWRIGLVEKNVHHTIKLSLKRINTFEEFDQTHFSKGKKA